MAKEVHTLEEQAALSAISPDDVERARLAWTKDAPRGWETLLDAKEDGDPASDPAN